MDHYLDRCIRLVSYDQIYSKKIQPKVSALDLFLKENSAPFNVYETASILEIEPQVLTEYMEAHHLSELDTNSLFQLILASPSELCGYIAREWKYQSESGYTPEMIADIYKLNLHKVKSAFHDLGTALITHVELIELFKRIHVTDFQPA